MALKGKMHPSLLLILVPIAVTAITVTVVGWRWAGLAAGMSGKTEYWFLRAAPVPALLFGPIAGLLTVWALRLHRRRPVAIASLLCFLAVGGFYASREYGRLAPLVKRGIVTWNQALAYLDMVAVSGALIGFMAVAIAARISVVVPEPVKRAKRGTFGDADWLPMSAAAKLFPPDGEIVIGERYRVDREIIHELPFDPNDRSTWGQGGRAPLLTYRQDFDSTHMLFFAGSGGFKTTSNVVPTALRYTGPLICLDPSTELAPMVITMEWIDGVKMSDVEGLKAAGHDLNALADTLIQSFLRHTLRDGFFHADMHPGNLFIDPAGMIVAVDMGIVGRLGKKERRFLAEILYGFITRDYLRVAEVHFEAGYVPSHHNMESFAQAIRAIGEPIHGQPAETISMGKLLTLLFEVTELFDMETRPELVMLQKTMVVVEGVSRMLNPRFNMWKASEPVVGDWIRTNLGPKRIMADLKDGLKAAVKLAEAAPEIAAKTEKFHHELLHMSENGLRFDPQTAEAIGKSEAKHSRSGRFALWVIALTLIYIAWHLG